MGICCSTSEEDKHNHPLVLNGELTDCFLTHDWGLDEYGRNNHDRVARINAYLQSRGLITWFDSDRMIGDLVSQMTTVIDMTQIVLVFITKRYIEKVDYAFSRKKKEMMIPIVMEGQMRDTSKWTEKIGKHLKNLCSHLFICLITYLFV